MCFRAKMCVRQGVEIAHFKPLPDLRLCNSFFLQSGKVIVLQSDFHSILGSISTRTRRMRQLADF